MSTRSIAAWHCGEQQRSERAGCGPAHVAVRPVARQRELRGSTGFIVRVHRSFTDAYWPFTDSEYCPFVGGRHRFGVSRCLLTVHCSLRRRFGPGSLRGGWWCGRGVRTRSARVRGR